MKASIARNLASVKSAIIAGDPVTALMTLEKLAATLEREGLPPADRTALTDAMSQLMVLAEASLRGARQASDEVQAIIQAARSLQTYDSDGCRRTALVTAPAPRRF
jgi:Na+-translocating ferredoxin:NAD+ oxidoreductase RNF subunit RnfB